ncbi:MAG TPA: hypothetical protein VK786_06785, partial [bacterium]|nr:hypothetical protein [bacterium]
AEKAAWSVADKFAAVLILLLLIPKQYWLLYSDSSISCVISPVLALLLFATLAVHRTGFRIFTDDKFSTTEKQP